ncbi:FAD-dependent oxidoreductase [Actinospica durhamensis]|uniref:FAD-dependent oxidoreductase n=1 Tax=Actinospica durhamensis TaxID=1508375 RepID=A0A941EVQ1_9ACTN|nr:FAD-dependent oxidoreductase [Actinospica durhamensis]MBR7835884.1 FAD-dependent oxidoreductase [Actinospica durhamensis]
MSEPEHACAVLVVDSDPVEREETVDGLRHHLGPAARVHGAGGLREAAEVLAHLAATGTPLALAVSAHRLVDGTGVELFGHVRGSSPTTKRLLLTTMDQADAAIQAINQAQTDRYAVLPAYPLEERILPIVDDLLGEWFAEHAAAQIGVTVLGHRFAAISYTVKDYLTRSLVPFTWMDLGEDPEAQALARDLNLPTPAPTTVLLDDGRCLFDPSIAELAKVLGLTQEATRQSYDLIIVGGGPAGLAAAVYGACEGMSVVVIEDDCPGGQAGVSPRIENYLGFPAGLSGADFAHRALAQARRLGVEWCAAKVATGLVPGGGSHMVTLDDGKTVVGRTVLIATGMTWRQLDAPGVEELHNAGVYYGSSEAEAKLAAGEDVVVAGSGNPAGQAALQFAAYARSVTLVVREDSLRGGGLSDRVADQIERRENIRVRTGVEVGEVRGYGRLEKVVLLEAGSGRTEVIPANSLYIMVGTVPCSEWVHGVLGVDEFGFVLTDAEVARRPELLPEPWPDERAPYLSETSIPGVFAAGDVRAGSVKRVGAAVGQGAVAVAAVAHYLRGLAEQDERAALEAGQAPEALEAPPRELEAPQE